MHYCTKFVLQSVYFEPIHDSTSARKGGFKIHNFKTKIVHNKSTLYSEFYFIFFILSTIYVFAVFEIKLSSKRISFRYLTYTIPKKIEQI